MVDMYVLQMFSEPALLVIYCCHQLNDPYAAKLDWSCLVADEGELGGLLYCLEVS